MKKPIKVVMLPVINANPIITLYLEIDTDKFIFVDFVSSKYKGTSQLQPHFAYITVAQDVEPIKEGDWIYDPINEKVGKTTKESDYKWMNRVDTIVKIIATTDSKLKISEKIVNEHDANIQVIKKIPQVQQSFLKEFVSNPDGDFEVEYDFIAHEITIDDYCITCESNGCNLEDEEKYKLRINQENTINITYV
tara:strand:- start:1489 stop:2067 length:579 start_codon:yes stop_codon:yes gene_type:complete